MYPPYSHCHRCGSQYESNLWPRVCVEDDCRAMVWRPIHPVAVLLQPVLDMDSLDPGERTRVGVILGRRGINPHLGQWALPGGFVEFGEQAEVAAAREIKEEMNIDVLGAPTFNHSFADDEGHFLLFFHGIVMDSINTAKMYQSSQECTEMKIVYEPEELAFESHTRALANYFNKYDPRFN